MERKEYFYKVRCKGSTGKEFETVTSTSAEEEWQAQAHCRFMAMKYSQAEIIEFTAISGEEFYEYKGV